ncbi:hypothetical protein [uncultured Draconibacterium sp.]|uniref:hypothetical protein n=1 Tax=uncultured Draconibacterium sp. TaxID=1573823 RepID=UPI002AA7FD09|nr:hypothetical protein [uncultured Draconibacterium sp.]
MKKYNLILYTVSGLTIITVLSVLLSNLFPDSIGNENFRTWGLGAVLAEIIGLFVLLTKNSIVSRHIDIYLAIPEEFQGMTTNIDWSYESCFIISKDFKHEVQLVKSEIGPGFKVYLNNELMSKIAGAELIEFQLKERNGREWKVSPFNLYDCTKSLEIVNLTKQELNYD